MAAKINEANSMLAISDGVEENKSDRLLPLVMKVKQNKKGVRVRSDFFFSLTYQTRANILALPPDI